MDESSVSICWTELPHHICLPNSTLLEKTARWPRPTFLLAPGLHMAYIQAGQDTQNIIKVRHLVLC